MDKPHLDKILNFMVGADKLKEVKRSGWLISKIKNPEHVGDHSYSTALLSYLLAKRMGLDADKCMIMALLHDINEAITGDIATRYDKRKQAVQSREKSLMERRNELKMLLPLSASDRKMFKSFMGALYLAKTKEARLVKQVDKLDYVIQLINYSKFMKSDERVNELFLTAESMMDIPEVVYLYNKVKRTIYRQRGMKL